MNRTETLKILSILKAAFPSSFRDLTPADAQTTVNLWTVQFADFEYAEVEAAVHCLISVRREGYSPTIGEVKSVLLQNREQGELTAPEAWALVMKAVRNGIYSCEEGFRSLPEAARRAVGSADRIREMAISTSFNESVEYSNFRRAYECYLSREKNLAMLPSSLRGTLGGLVSGAELPAGQTAPAPDGSSPI